MFYDVKTGKLFLRKETLNNLLLVLITGDMLKVAYLIYVIFNYQET